MNARTRVPDQNNFHTSAALLPHQHCEVELRLQTSFRPFRLPQGGQVVPHQGILTMHPRPCLILGGMDRLRRASILPLLPLLPQRTLPMVVAVEMARVYLGCSRGIALALLRLLGQLTTARRLLPMGTLGMPLALGLPICLLRHRERTLPARVVNRIARVRVGRHRLLRI